MEFDEEMDQAARKIQDKYRKRPKKNEKKADNGSFYYIYKKFNFNIKGKKESKIEKNEKKEGISSLKYIYILIFSHRKPRENRDGVRSGNGGSSHNNPEEI